MLLEYITYFVMIYVSVFYLLVYFQHRHRLQDPRTRATPSVSVVIPAYNEGKNVAKCIESVLGLRYPKDKLEVIVVDDGSTDNTAQVARRYAARGNVRVFRKPNGGKASALNYSIPKARGEFIAVLDADSFVEPEALRSMLGYFKDPQVGAVLPTLKVFEPRGVIARIQKAEYLLIAFYKKILSFINSISVTPGPFALYRREVFEKLGGFDEDTCTEDMEMALRMQRANYKICNSYGAIVHTVVPATPIGFFKQRRRWYRGYLENIFKYKEIWSPRYGDFGVVVLPLGFVGLALSTLVFLYYLFNQVSKFRLAFHTPIDAFYLQAMMPEMLILVLLFMTFLTVLIVYKIFREQNPVSTFASIFVVYHLLMAAWLYTLVEAGVDTIRGKRGIRW